MQTAFTFSEERKCRGPGEERHRRATSRAHFPHPGSRSGELAPRKCSTYQLASSQNTNPHLRSIQHKFTNSNRIIVRFSNLYSRGERLQKPAADVLQQYNAPQRNTLLKFMPCLRGGGRGGGRRINCCFMHPSSQLLRATTGPVAKHIDRAGRRQAQ